MAQTSEIRRSRSNKYSRLVPFIVKCHLKFAIPLLFNEHAFKQAKHIFFKLNEV
jgi:hypothetical protein